MLNFYYNSLTYPRVTINDILQLASKFDLKTKKIIYEKDIDWKKKIKLSNSVKDFWKIIKNNYPSLSKKELLSGMTHIVLKKK